jgi:hypothetical protein
VARCSQGGASGDGASSGGDGKESSGSEASIGDRESSGGDRPRRGSRGESNKPARQRQAAAVWSIFYPICPSICYVCPVHFKLDMKLQVFGHFKIKSMKYVSSKW